MSLVDLAIPGQIETAQGQLCPVTVSDLSENDCRMDRALDESEAGSLLQLWLGAIGPFRVRVNSQGTDRLDFDGPIHPAIVAHFTA